MKLEEILQTYPVETLEQLASDKVMDVGHIRLPKDVLIEELCGVIRKYSYVEKAIALRNPPYFQILELLINQPGHRHVVKGFKSKVVEFTENLITMAKNKEGLRPRKDYDLYLKMLKIAWEHEGQIDTSEAHLLNVLREELDISFKEHVILQHHESLVQYWMKENYYERERNFLIAMGIVYPIEDYYVIPESLVRYTRKIWGMDLTGEQYHRLLSYLSNNDLSSVLQRNELQISGVSEAKIKRIIDNYIWPKKALNCLSLESLKELARNSGSVISGSKEEVIDNLIDFFDDDGDLKLKEKDKMTVEFVPEMKLLNEQMFTNLFNLLSIEQLYNIADDLPRMRKSGSKEMKIKNLWNSPFNEITILDVLTNSELYVLCEKNNLKVSGPKAEKIKRIIDAVKNYVVGKVTQSIDESKTSLEIIKESTLQSNIINEPLQKLQSDEVFKTLEKQFIYLDKYEILFLSWLKDLKSISEYELERLIARHNLPWYFPKTQIEKLKEKLANDNNDLINVRHIGDYNIYELKIDN